MVFGMIFEQGLVYKLHIGQHFFFTTLAGAFAKATVVNHHYIIIVPVKVTAIFSPAFDTAGIAVEVKDQSFGLFPVEVKAIDANARCYIKEQFLKGNIVFEGKVGRQPLRFKDKAVLE